MTRRDWVTDAEFLDLLGDTNLILRGAAPARFILELALATLLLSSPPLPPLP